MSKKHTRFSLIAGLSLAFIFLASHLFSADTLSEGSDWYLADKTIALVNATPILQSQIDSQIELLKKRKVSKKDLKNVEFKVLDDFIDEALLMQAAERESIIISDEKVDLTIEQQMKFQGIKDLETYKKQVEKKDKLPFDVYREELRKMLVIEQIMVYAMDFVPPSEAEAKEWYEKNKKMLLQAKFQHILVKPKDDSFAAEKNANNLIENLLKRAKSGENFGKLARQFSEDPGSAKNGGLVDWTFFHQLDPQFAYQVYNMKKRGSISNVFKSSYGYHIVKFYGKRTQPYDEIRDRIFNMLAQQSRTSQFKTWVKGQRKHAEIIVYLDGYSNFLKENK